MAAEDTERLLVKIGQLLAEDREYPLDGTLLYATLDRNTVAPSIFKDRGDHVLYRWPDLRDLGDALLDLWEAQGTGDRWSEMEYIVRDGKFEVTYTYPDEIDPDEEPMARRDRIVRHHLGDRPIKYPPWPPEDSFPKYEL